MIIKPRLKFHKIREMVKDMARDKKAKYMERFEARLKEDGWHIIVSACYQLDELEKTLAKEIRLREMADAKIRSLQKK